MKKKQIVQVQDINIYITATFNNTLITITNDKNQPIVVNSCGRLGFTGTRKSTPHAASLATDAAVKKVIEENGARNASIYVKGIGPGREAALRVIRATSLSVNKIVDQTPIPHNGVRPPKVRRM